MKNEITYLSAVRYAVENGNLPAEYADKLSALADQLDKRSHAIRKPTAKQKQSAEARDTILNAMERGVVYSAADIAKMFGETSAWAAPKLNALVAAGLVSKTVEKRKGFYTLAE